MTEAPLQCENDLICGHEYDQSKIVPRAVYHRDFFVFHVGFHHRNGGCIDSALEGCF